jgi:hypothetical protein
VNANIPGSSIMCCADAGDAISANRTAAPRNLIPVIGLLLIIDPRTLKWIVREQDHHRCGDIPVAAITLRRTQIYIAREDVMECGGVIYFCRPGLDPGPIRRGRGCRKRKTTTVVQTMVPVAMGPGSRPGRHRVYCHEEIYIFITA